MKISYIGAYLLPPIVPMILKKFVGVTLLIAYLRGLKWNGCWTLAQTKVT